MDKQLDLLPTPLRKSSAQAELEEMIRKELESFWYEILPFKVLENLLGVILGEQAERAAYQNDNLYVVEDSNYKCSQDVIDGLADWSHIIDLFFAVDELPTIDILSYTHRGKYSRDEIMSRYLLDLMVQFIELSSGEVKIYNNKINKTRTGFPGWSANLEPDDNLGIRRVRAEKRLKTIAQNANNKILVARFVDLKLVFDRSDRELLCWLRESNLVYEYDTNGRSKPVTVHLPIATNFFLGDLNLDERGSLRINCRL